MKNYSFTVNGEWQGGWQGVGHVQSKGIDTVISVDQSMNGKGVGTNPDELLIASVQSCYLMTLGIHLDSHHIAYESISIRSEGVVTDEGGLHFQSITHYPVLKLAQDADKETYRAAEEVVASAERYCMIAKALKGNVEISVHPKIIQNELSEK